jgi:hypothetical protein
VAAVDGERQAEHIRQQPGAEHVVEAAGGGHPPAVQPVPASLTATIIRALRYVGAGRFLSDGTGVGG